MTDIEKHTPVSQSLAQTDSWVPVLGAVGDLAGKLAGTDFVPRAIRRQPAAVAATILTGREMGLGPMASLRGIDVIEGKPSLTAQMLAAKIYAAGHRIEWVTSDDKRCTVRIERGDGLSAAEATWTLGDAQRAGLAGKKVWQQYPRHLLRARALTECAAMACPDVALGLDVAADPDQQPHTAEGTSPTTVIRLTTAEPRADAQPDMAVPDADSDAQPPTAPPEGETPEEPSVGAQQLRKLNAQIGELERHQGRRMTRDERRDLIRDLVGLDTLSSAKELTRAQASTAIDALAALLAVTPPDSDVLEAEIVDGEDGHGG